MLAKLERAAKIPLCILDAQDTAETERQDAQGLASWIKRAGKLTKAAAKLT